MPTIRSFRGILEIYYSNYCGQYQNSNFLRIKWFLYLMWTCSVLRAGRTIALVWTQYSSFVGTTAVLHSNVVLPTWLYFGCVLCICSFAVALTQRLAVRTLASQLTNNVMYCCRCVLDCSRCAYCAIPKTMAIPHFHMLFSILSRSLFTGLWL